MSGVYITSEAHELTALNYLDDLIALAAFTGSLNLLYVYLQCVPLHLLNGSGHFSRERAR